MAEPNTSSTNSATSRSTPETSTSSSSTGSARRAESSEQKSGIVDRVKEQATAQLTSQKNRGIDALGSVAGAVRSTTQKLREEQHDTIAGYVDSAADQIENWSRRLREKGIDELLTDVQRLARRQPIVFIGSAFALGVVGARFLKSSRAPEGGYVGESRRIRHGDSATAAAYDRGALASAVDEDDDELKTKGNSASTRAESTSGSATERVEGSSERVGGSSRARKTGSRTERS